MRNRFFIIILTTIILVAVGVNLVQNYFFESQRLKLIDQLIDESTASLLGSAEFVGAMGTDRETIDPIVTKILSSDRIGKLIIVADEHGKPIFQSLNMRLMRIDLPLTPGWSTLWYEGQYIRSRAVVVQQNPYRVLYIGLVLDQNFLHWKILDRHVVTYMIGIVIASFFASVLLTLVLLSPLRLLINHLHEMKNNLTNLKRVAPLPKHLTRYTKGYWATSDEFSDLLSSVQNLIDRINLNYNLTRSWTLQMAHELKTPLSIIRAETEANKKTGAVSNRAAEDIFREVHLMTSTVSQFLDWAELENTPVEKNLHALYMSNVLTEVTDRLDKISPGRIHLKIDRDFPVHANPNHLDQLITNIVTNALKFSDKPVEVTLQGQTLRVMDQGTGIPESVKQRLGEPFNVGPHDEKSSAKGNGLGLAWISTITKLYRWNLDIQSNCHGTSTSIQFPDEEST